VASAVPGGTGSSKWGTRFEFAGVIVAAVAAALSFGAAREANRTADSADATAKALREIEQERHSDERLEDLVAAQMARYFTSPCETQAEMLAPSVRFFDSPEELTPEQVLQECKGDTANNEEPNTAAATNDEPSTDDTPRRFVLHGVNVIGTPTDGRATALVDRGFYDTDDHVLAGVSRLEVVLKVSPGWTEDSTFPIIRIRETILAP
jgi:hypothetical protein